MHIRELKQLKTKKGRNESGLFIIEGEKFINEIPISWRIEKYVLAKRFVAGRDLSTYINRAPVEVVHDSQFDKLADTVSPQGIMAICHKQNCQIDQLLTTVGFLLAGECLNDPGNIGTLIRTAAAAGAKGVILTQDSCDIYNPKVIRASAGATLRLPIVTDITLNVAIDKLKHAKYAIYAAHPRGDTLPYSLNLNNNFCLLVGNESHGLTPEASALADAWVRLPMANDMESLNASIAGSILMYEALRQRGHYI